MNRRNKMRHKKQVLVSVVWLAPKEGGRSPIPVGVEYCPCAGFADMSQYWGVRIVLNEYISEREAIGIMRPVAPTAPFSLFRKDPRFGIYEGARLVATGVVLKRLHWWSSFFKNN